MRPGASVDQEHDRMPIKCTRVIGLVPPSHRAGIAIRRNGAG